MCVLFDDADEYTKMIITSLWSACARNLKQQEEEEEEAEVEKGKN